MKGTKKKEYSTKKKRNGKRLLVNVLLEYTWWNNLDEFVLVTYGHTLSNLSFAIIMRVLTHLNELHSDRPFHLFYITDNTYPKRKKTHHIPRNLSEICSTFTEYLYQIVNSCVFSCANVCSWSNNVYVNVENQSESKRANTS